jgi:hypothetical protein
MFRPALARVVLADDSVRLQSDRACLLTRLEEVRYHLATSGPWDDTRGSTFVLIPFSYEQFSDWYEGYRTQFLVSARDSAVRALTELLDRELREPERVRVDVRPGRLKSTRRAWQKLNTSP